MTQPDKLEAYRLVLLEALTGTTTINEYPDTLIDRVDAALAAAWELVKGLDVKVPAYTASPAGPFRSPNMNTSDAIVDQVTAKWPGPALKPRTLLEKVTLLDALVRGAAANRRLDPVASPQKPPAPAPPTVVPPDRAPQGWRKLPVPTAATFTGASDSWQSGQPTFETDGVHVALPATGGAPRGRAVPIESGKQRCELYVVNAGDLRAGMSRAFRLDFELKRGFPTGTNEWQLIAQWKNAGTGSPPLSLEITHNELRLQWHDKNGKPVGSRKLANAYVGIYSVVIDIDFSEDVKKSLVDGYVNGDQVLASASVAPTCYPGKSNYLKIGLYRGNVGQSAEVVFRAVAHAPKVSDLT